MRVAIYFCSAIALLICADSTATTSTPTESNVTTLVPTVSLTQGCPEYFWVGGTQQKICRAHDRCNCYVGNKDCCLVEPVFEDGYYDAARKHHSKDDCKLDVQFARWNADDGESKGSSPGYLLTINKHYFAVDVIPEDYECGMDIYWRFEWEYTNSSDNQDPLARIGLEIDMVDGWLHPQNASDKRELQVPFTVKWMECDDSNRRPDGSCFDDFYDVPIYGRLVIVNATSQCRPDCYDGRIYPMEIPVYFRYVVNIDCFPPCGDEQENSKELPSWFGWMVAGSVILVWCLALLVYTYWNRRKAQAAGVKSEVEIGNELKENQVGLNPSITGFNPNVTADGVSNGAPDQGGVASTDIIRTNVERPV